MKTKKDTDKKEMKISKKKKKEAKRSYVRDLLPIISKHENLDVINMDDGKIIDILKVKTKDIYSSPEDDNAFDNSCWERIFNMYGDDIKFIHMLYPTNTNKQQKYVKHLLNRTENPVCRQELEIKLAEEMWISENRKDTEVYLMIFAKDEKDYKDKLIMLFANLSKGASPMIEHVDMEKKINVIKKCTNKNMEVG